MRAQIVGAAIVAMGLASTASAASMTFANSSSITIPDNGTASPYPSIIDASGLAGLITNVTVMVSGFSHTFPDDVGALLVGPNGQNLVLFNGAGGSVAAANLTWTFDDAALETLPGSGSLDSGTFRPSNVFPSDNFPAPAPAGPYGQALAVFQGQPASGLWQLYVVDFVNGDSGTIANGWSLSITTDAQVVPEPSLLALLGAGLIGAAARKRRRSPGK